MKFLTAVWFSFLAIVCSQAAAPLSLNPENPHYFLYHEKPLILITSGEHYGAVLNLDFNYKTYLGELAANHLNLTRTWTGVYMEAPGNFNIAQNTLAPLSGRLICPYRRSAQLGYFNGGNKFDLTQWDPAYFKRLKDFLSYARRKDVIVELNLFCPFYEESMWKISPMNAINNINGVGDIARTNVYTLNKNGGLLPYQETLVRKLAKELNQFENFYFEICNEPYFGGVTAEWQARIAEVITESEKNLPKQHLISQNIANNHQKIKAPNENVSIFNFHYATPPVTVDENFGLNKVIGDNETGFNGTNNFAYRREAWEFITAGGGLFNNLDYSFVAGHEIGDFQYPANQPGGGNPIYRKEIEFLAQTIQSLDFIHMSPHNELLSGSVPSSVRTRTLAKPGSIYLIYTTSIADIKKNPPEALPRLSFTQAVNLPPGEYQYQWLDPLLRSKSLPAKFSHAGGEKWFEYPSFSQDQALLIRKQ